MTIREAFVDATQLLEQQNVSNPRLCAEALLTYCLKVDRTYLYTHSDRSIDHDEYALLESAIYERITGVPLQYIVGSQEFYGRDFTVNPSVLIPRPETEFIIEAVLETKPAEPARIIDVGTGSGCIAVTLALELPGTTVVAGDISEAALKVAEFNNRNLGANVAFVCMDALDAITGPFDFVVSNPPYIPLAELPQLQREVRDHEPHLALFAPGGDLEIYRRLIRSSFDILNPGGRLIMEVGFGMGESIISLLTDGWEQSRIKSDLQGIPRTVVIEKRGKTPPAFGHPPSKGGT